MGDHGDDGDDGDHGHKKGHTGGIVGSKFITTGGIVCCLSCLLLLLHVYHQL